MMRKMLVAGLFITGSLPVFSQDEESVTREKKSPFSVSGSADVYYKFDFQQQKLNGLTSFTQSHNQILLGMASAMLKYETSKTSIVVDIGFGNRARDFSYADEGALQALKQAYISYTPVENLTFTAGSWGTHVGYEVLDAYLNRNYSMSYMFSTGPFSHTGLKAEYAAGKSSFMVGVANPTDYKYVPDDVINKKFIIAQYGLNLGDDLSAYVNYAGGKYIDTAKMHQFDLSLTSHISPKFWLGFNGTVGLKKLWEGEGKYSDTKTWSGAAIYLNGDFSDLFGVTLREEYFNDKDGLTAISTAGGNVFSSTLSFNIKPDAHFTIIPEVRVDAASKPLFFKKDNDPTKTNANFLIAATYNF